MSNVTPREIMDLTASVFGLLPSAFRGHFYGEWKSRRRPKPLKARQVAVYLIQRHTLATNPEIAALFGHMRYSPAKMAFDEQSAQIAAELEDDYDLDEIVAALEDRIDELHETRIEPPAPAPAPVKKAKKPTKTPKRQLELF